MEVKEPAGLRARRPEYLGSLAESHPARICGKQARPWVTENAIC